MKISCLKSLLPAPADGVAWSITCDISAIHLDYQGHPSQHVQDEGINFKVWKSEGREYSLADATEIKVYWLEYESETESTKYLLTRTGNVYNTGGITTQPLYKGRAEVWDTRDTVMYTMIDIPAVSDGSPGGETGPAGPIFYPAGKWDASTRFESDNTKMPYVLYGSNYYYLKQGKIVIGNPDPATSYAQDGDWVLMDKLKVAIAEAIIADFGKIGSAVFWGDYMFSQYGLNPQGYTTNAYEQFCNVDQSNPYSGLNYFRPNWCVDLKHGEMWLGCGKCHFNTNGLVEIEGGFIAFDSRRQLVKPANLQLYPAFDKSTFVDVSVNDTTYQDRYYILPDAELFNGIDYELIATEVGLNGKIKCDASETIVFRGVRSCRKFTFSGIIRLRAIYYDERKWWEVIGGEYTIHNYNN